MSKFERNQADFTHSYFAIKEIKNSYFWLESTPESKIIHICPSHWDEMARKLKQNVYYIFKIKINLIGFSITVNPQRTPSTPECALKKKRIQNTHINIS